MSRLRVSLTLTILMAFALVFSLILGLTIIGYRNAGSAAALATADTSLAQVSATVSARTDAMVRPVLALTRAAAANGIVEALPPTREETRMLAALLTATPDVQAVSVGWADGAVLQVAGMGGVAASLLPGPPPDGTAMLLRYAAPGETAGHWRFLSADGDLLGQAAAAAPADTRAAQWYLQAESPGVQISTLYTLDLSRQPGLSISSAMAGGGVVSVDLSLARLGAFLQAQLVTPHTFPFLFSDLGIVLAVPDSARAVAAGGEGGVRWITLQGSHDPLLRAVWAAYATGTLLPGSGAVLTVDGHPMLARLEAVAGMASPPVMAAVVAPRSDFTKAVDQAVQHGTILALAAALAGLSAIALVSWRIARPLAALTREAQAIRRLELDAPVPVHSYISEVENLAVAVAAMKATLGSFAAYMPRDLVQQFLQAGTEPHLGGERTKLSLLFTDVANFTAISEKLDPLELTAIISAYLEAVTTELLACRATIDKYIGDAVMAFWNAPRTDTEHAAHACLAALRTRAVTVRLEESFAARGWPQLYTRFGVHTGDAVVGNIGSSDRMTYTAMGAAVNLASRLEGLNKIYQTQILVSDATRLAAGSGFLFRPVDIVVAKGTERPEPIFELLGLADATAPQELRPFASDLLTLPAWEACVAAYRDGRFDAARAALAEVRAVQAFPLSGIYAARLAELGRTAAPEWSPTLRLLTK
jgi:adenylate cyclase